ncbi:uncharacterized protein LOC120358389 [Solenopsis invicta]|uniref:uncharacterized protein LOC120358389 n=1 Tax=Solenopsis invicta TaxID=13686 RepID=UPI00193CD2D2|nr:uncharacterized protein LOC120358389 [Solenopsis invicta]
MDPRVMAIILIIAWARETAGIIGYDCGSPMANITTMSLLNTEECDIPLQRVNQTKKYIQLLQINEFKTVKVIQCKVEIDRIVKTCGMFSHTGDVLNGKYSYIEETSRETCMKMQWIGTYRHGNTVISDLKANQSVSRPVTLAGHIGNAGTCHGTSYSDSFGSWTNVIVLATVKITLQDYEATVQLNSNRIVLRSGVTCDFKSTQCVDLEGGNTYWDPLPPSQCALSNFGSLYDGFADVLVDDTGKESQVVYSLNSQETTFALTMRGQYTHCGYTLIRTEHPKLLIYETTFGSSIFGKEYRPQNLDIFAYINSKFLYVEKHVRTQVNELYRNVLQQQCTLEQKVLKNALALATHAPDAFAYHIMQDIWLC